MTGSDGRLARESSVSARCASASASAESESLAATSESGVPSMWRRRVSARWWVVCRVGWALAGVNTESV